MKPKRNSKLWAYLEAGGWLARGETGIQEGKKAFYREYHKNYKQNQRAKGRIISSYFKASEVTQLAMAAQKYGVSDSQVVKMLVSAYLHQEYLVPHPQVLVSIKQSLLRCQSDIERIAERDKGGFLRLDRNYDDLQAIIRQAQADIQQAFADPPSLISAIEAALRKNPAFADTLRNLLAAYDPQRLLP